MQAGDIKTTNFQSDVHGGQYRLVEDLGDGRWIVEDLAPSDETIESIIADALATVERYRTSPRGFGHDSEDGILDRADEDIARRTARAGERREIRIVSSDEWARYF